MGPELVLTLALCMNITVENATDTWTKRDYEMMTQAMSVCSSKYDGRLVKFIKKTDQD